MTIEKDSSSLETETKIRKLLSRHKDREKIAHRILWPIAMEFQLKDILQIIIGATILAIPVGFTEETWHMGENLPFMNVLCLALMSFVFISFFTYYHYHKHRINLKKHWGQFLKRVLATYVFSFITVGLILTIIQRAPWATDFIIAIKRVIIVTLPASMSATVADTIK